MGKINYENYIRNLVMDSTYDNIGEYIITIANNTRNFIMDPQLEHPNIYDDIQGETIRRASEQMAYDIDREIMNRIDGTPNPLSPDYLIDDINIYRKEILIKKYGFR